MERQKRPRSTSLTGRACVNCQKRKSRCSGTGSRVGGACSYCSTRGKICSFNEPPNRTPLTRRHLDAAEFQCSQLRSLVQSLDPNLDIDVALEQLDKHGSNAFSPKLPQGRDSQSAGGEYEWHEPPLSPLSVKLGNDPPNQDGMATLSNLDAGYLGSSSGSTLLHEIASLLPELRPASESSASPRSQEQSPSGLGPSAAIGHFDPLYFTSSTIKGRLIDAYFLFYNSSYPILHEKTFREKAAVKQKIAPMSTWHLIYYMVLAIGHWISTANKPGIQSPYYMMARSSLSMHILESGTIETIQAFLLMGNYLQKRDRPNTGYNFIGIAYRMALGLGLHRELHDSEDNILHERRRQLFWTLFCFDSGFNITTGRPPTISEGFIDCRLPRNIDDKDNALLSSVPQPVDYPTPYSALIAQAQLASIASSVYAEYLLAKTAKTKIEYQTADAMDKRLNEWRESLPSHFTSPQVPAWFFGPRSIVLWKEQNLQILLWRGSKQYHRFLPSKVDAEHRCRDIAMQTIHDIATFSTEYEGILHLGINWYATYFLFQATLVIEACRLGERSQPHQVEDNDGMAWETAIFKARHCLEILAQNNNSASRCLGILDRIHKHFTAAPDSGTDFDQWANAISRNSLMAGEQQGYQADEPFFSPHTEDYDVTSIRGPQPFLGSFAPDETLRMLMDQTPLDFFNASSMDFLFN